MKTLLALLILIPIVSSNLLAKPGDTYHCKKVIGEFMKVSYGTKAITREVWGSSDFHFKWNKDETLKFSVETFAHSLDMKVQSWKPEFGELFQADRNDGQTYMHYIDGLFTYSHTADGRLWVMIADCEIVSF